jgi:hypothetical protein
MAVSTVRGRAALDDHGYPWERWWEMFGLKDPEEFST